MRDVQTMAPALTMGLCGLSVGHKADSEELDIYERLWWKCATSALLKCYITSCL